MNKLTSEEIHSKISDLKKSRINLFVEQSTIDRKLFEIANEIAILRAACEHHYTWSDIGTYCDFCGEEVGQ